MVSLSKALFEQIRFQMLTASQGFDSKPIIKVHYECDKGYSSDQTFSDTDKFNNISHLGFHIRKIIRVLEDKGFENSRAICDFNPWNIQIKVDRDKFIIVNDMF